MTQFSSASTGSEPPAKTSALAVAGMITGFFGCLILPAVAGLVMSIIALTQISGSNGRLKGSGFAVAGLVLSFLTLPTFLLVGVLLPALASTRAAARSIKDEIALREVATAFQAYQHAHDGAFPPGTNWDVALEAIDPMIPQHLQSWSADRTGRSFAMNILLDGLAAQDLETPDTIILIFECDPGAPSAGGPELLPGRPRAPQGYLIMTADGLVETYTTDEINGSLDWTP